MIVASFLNCPGGVPRSWPMCPGGLVKSVVLGTTGFGLLFGAAWAEPAPSPRVAAPSAPASVAVPAIFFRFIVVSFCLSLRPLDEERVDVRLDGKTNNQNPLKLRRQPLL